MTVSKVHVTITLTIIACVSIVSAVVLACVLVTNGVEASTIGLVCAPFLAIASGCLGGIAGVAVPTSET
jgi:hypothetical protein